MKKYFNEQTRKYEKPVHKHDCDECTYLGFSRYDTTHFDLYFCEQSGGLPTVIARWGDEGPKYISGLRSREYCLVVARKRAIDLGLYGLECQYPLAVRRAWLGEPNGIEEVVDCVERACTGGLLSPITPQLLLDLEGRIKTELNRLQFRGLMGPDLPGFKLSIDSLNGRLVFKWVCEEYNSVPGQVDER
jgi:hypothetical protein